MTAHRYEATVDLSVDDVHSRVIRLVGSGKRVLELGCSSGYVGRVLIEQFGCTVWGVERDGEAAALARERGLRVMAADLDGLDFAAAFGDERFDVALCADVLEHLREPGPLLRQLRAVLAAGGYLVASVPNIAHVSIVAELLEGRFDYRPLGLLDATHLHFFTRHTLCAVLRDGGFVLTHLERLCRRPEETEFRTDLRRLPREVQALLLSREEATTYQFVVQAVPADALPSEPPPGDDRAAPVPTGRVPEREEALRIWARFLEEDRERDRRELREFQEQARNLWDMIRERDRSLAERDRSLAEVRDRVEALEGEIRRRDQELAEASERIRTLVAENAEPVWRRLLRRWRRS